MFIAQKTKKNRKRHASNEEFKVFVENNLLNENEIISDKNVIIEPSKVSFTEERDIKYE